MFKKNLTLLSIINVYVKLTSLAIVPFIARRFTVEEFGILAVAQTILGYSLDCFDGGIKKVGIKELSRRQGKSFLVVAERIFTARILLLIAAFVFMNLTGAIFFQDQGQRIIVMIISLSILAQILDITWIYDSQQDMKPASLGKFIERTVFLVLSVAGIYWLNMNVLAFSFPAAAAISVLIIWFFKNKFKIRPRMFDIRLDYIKEGLIIGFAGIAASLCLTIDQFMIKQYMDTYDLGLYCAATKIFFVILTFLWLYSYALFPRLSGAVADKEEIRRILTKHTLGLGLAGTATVALLCFFSTPLIRVLFSEKFLAVLPVVKMLNFFLIISFFNVLYSDSLNAFNKQSQRMMIIVTALVLNIILNVFLIPAYGLLGAVYASICAQLLILVLSYVEVKKIYSINSGGYIGGFLLAGLLLVGLSFEFPGVMLP